MAPAASDAPTAAPGPGYLPPPVIGRALDVLNAPGLTREEFQAAFNSRNSGPGHMEYVTPKLREELRLESAEGRDQAQKEAKELRKSLIDPQTYLRPLDPPLPGGMHQLKRFPEPP